MGKINYKLVIMFTIIFSLNLISASISTGVDGIIGLDLNAEAPTFNNNTAFVNASNHWNTNSLGSLDDANSTQFENVGGVLTIVPSWLDGLYCSIFGCTMGGDINMDDNDIYNIKNLTTTNLNVTDNVNIYGDFKSLNNADDYDYPGSESAFKVIRKSENHPSTSEIALEYWIESDVKKDYYVAGMWGGYFDRGTSAPDQNAIYGANGWNMYSATNDRDVAITIGSLFGNEISGNNLNIQDAYGATSNVVYEYGINNTIDNAYGNYIFENLIFGSGSSIENAYGLYVQEHATANNNWNIYSDGGRNYFGGDVGIGTDDPNVELEVIGDVNITEDLNVEGNIILNNNSQIQDSESNNYIQYVEVNGDGRLRVAG